MMAPSATLALDSSPSASDIAAAGSEPFPVQVACARPVLMAPALLVRRRNAVGELSNVIRPSSWLGVRWAASDRVALIAAARGAPAMLAF